MNYTPVGWKNNQSPPISAENLNHMDEQIRKNAKEFESFEDKKSSNQKFANALKGTANGVSISVVDASPIEHDLSVKVESKNRINIESAFLNSDFEQYLTKLTTDSNTLRFEKDYDGNVSAGCSVYAYLEPGTYTFSGIGETNGDGNMAYVIYNPDGSQLGGTITIGKTYQEFKHSIMVSQSGRYTFVMYIGWSAANGSYVSYTNLLLEKGEAQTEYTPFIYPEDIAVIKLIDGVEVQSETPSADGTVKGFTSSPAFELISSEDDGSVLINLEYNKDINKISFGGGTGTGDGFSPIATVGQTADGVVITITDKKGTTTATVKNGRDGEDGYTPVKNVDYFDGKDGTSVTVSKVTESTSDGGSNVVTFSDGKTVTIKNGSKGDKGYTPQKNVDYYTEEDKAEFSQYIASELAKRGQLAPEYASSIEECTDTTKLYVLPDGFIYAYMLTEKETTSGGYKNCLPLATETYNGTKVYGDKGYVTGYRLSGSSGSASAQSGMLTTGFIPASDGARIRTVGFTAQNATMGCQVVSYNSSGSRISNYQWGTGGTYATDDLYIADFTLDSAKYGTGIAFIRICASDDSNPEIITVNQEIKESSTTITKEYAWTNTGLAFVPADYEDRIITLEDNVDGLKKSISTTGLNVSQVFAPSPQLPADGTEKADFNAATVTAEEIYAYIDTLVAKYPKYITKEVLGKDESGKHDWCRYTLSRRYYDAWQKVNYPKMYAWVSGSTTIYSVSVSPRIDDVMYSTTYVGTTYAKVTSVDTPNQTRTVNGLVFTRKPEADVLPTLVYTETGYSPYFVGGYAGLKNTVYNSVKGKASTIATYTGDTMTDASGVSYARYPLGDRDNTFAEMPVIVIGSNEHGRIKETNGKGIGGDPATPAIISARMIKDLCECVNSNNPFINLLKNNYKIVFCPVINPWGLSAVALNNGSYGGYVNSNNVNIDRNFDTQGWGNDSDVRHGAYGGSENETQYFMNTLVESKASFAMANHGLGTQVNSSTGEATNAGLCHYMFGRVNSKYNDALTSTGAVMEANYNLVYTSYTEAKPEEYAKTRSYIALIGAEGGAVEMQSREGFILAGEGQEYTARIMEANYTLLLQFLYMIMDKQES